MQRKERQSSDWHRGRRPRNSPDQRAHEVAPEPEWRCAVPVCRLRRAAKSLREFRPLRGRCRRERRRSWPLCLLRPRPFPPFSRSGPGPCSGRSASLQTGIAAAGRETPPTSVPMKSRRSRNGAAPSLFVGCAVRPNRSGSFARCAGDAGVNAGAPGPGAFFAPGGEQRPVRAAAPRRGPGSATGRSRPRRRSAQPGRIPARRPRERARPTSGGGSPGGVRSRQAPGREGAPG